MKNIDLIVDQPLLISIYRGYFLRIYGSFILHNTCCFVQHTTDLQTFLFAEL